MNGPPFWGLVLIVLTASSIAVLFWLHTEVGLCCLCMCVGGEGSVLAVRA